MDTEYWAGTALFGMMLAILILSVFGLFAGVSLVVAGYMWAEFGMAVGAGILAAISLAGVVFTYMWFTKPV